MTTTRLHGVEGGHDVGSTVSAEPQLGVEGAEPLGPAHTWPSPSSADT
jgi:hypothetical protein